MIEAKVYSQEGKETGKVKLDSKVFEIKPNEVLLKQAVSRYLASLREPIAKTKTRSERRGGGKKPWRQKGTGRARTGSRRNPIWRKGGVIFGPTGKENFTKNLPKKALRKAILMSLSTKAKDGRIVVLKDIKLEKPKTKKVKVILDKLPIERRILIISVPDPIFLKSTDNIPLVLSTLYNQLNVYDILVADYLVILESALGKIGEVYAKLKKETRKEQGIEVEEKPEKKPEKKTKAPVKKPKKSVAKTSRSVKKEQK